MAKKQMNYDYMYKGQKNITKGTTDGKYTPGMVGKITMAITIPSALIAFISVMMAISGIQQAILVTVVTFIISFVGSIVLAIDIVIFNRKERKKYKDTEAPKGPDIMRILHLIIGVFVGIIIGYLLWGAKN